MSVIYPTAPAPSLGRAIYRDYLNACVEIAKLSAQQGKPITSSNKETFRPQGVETCALDYSNPKSAFLCGGCPAKFKSGNSLHAHLRNHPTHRRSLSKKTEQHSGVKLNDDKKPEVAKGPPHPTQDTKQTPEKKRALYVQTYSVANKNRYSILDGCLHYPMQDTREKGLKPSFMNPKATRPKSVRFIPELTQRSRREIKEKVERLRVTQQLSSASAPWTKTGINVSTVSELRKWSDVPRIVSYANRKGIKVKPLKSHSKSSPERDELLTDRVGNDSSGSSFKFSTPPIYFPSAFSDEPSGSRHERRESIFSRTGDDELFDSE